MEALQALCNRVSVARLTEPGPTAAQLEVLLRAGARAPDHKQLRPWRLLLVADAAREALGELFAQALLQREPQAEAAALDKARRMPLRAPLVVVVIATPQAHPKVPEAEQLLTAGCVAHGLVTAAFAQGLGAVWRSGDFARDPWVLQGLGLGEGEQVVGFVYVGTPEQAPRTPAPLDLAAHVNHWSAPVAPAG